MTVADQHRSKTILAKARSALRRWLSIQFWRSRQRILGRAKSDKDLKNRVVNQQHRTDPIVPIRNKKIESLFAAPPADWTPEQQIFLARALKQLDLLPERALHKLMARLLANREIALLNSLVDDAAVGFDLIRDYYRICLASYCADDSVNIEAIVELYNKAHCSFLRYRILNTLMTSAAKFAAVDVVESMLSTLEKHDYARLKKTTVFGVSQLLIKNESYKAAASLLNCYLAEADRSLWLYYIEPLLKLEDSGELTPALKDFCANLRPSINVATRHLLRSTYEAVDETDRANFDRLIIKNLPDLAKHSQNLMDVRFSSGQRAVLIETLESHIVQQRPLSLLRLNDGEAYAYDAPNVEGIDSGLFVADNEIRERHWWGSSPPHALRNDIVMRVRRAVERCDILGVPSIYRVVRDMPRPGQRYGEGRSQRGLIVVLGACANAIPLHDKIITEERCHQSAIDEKILGRLASLSRSVVVVSCWPKDKLRLPFPVQAHINVPPAQKLKRLDERDTPPLFQIYPRILAQVREAASPGTLVLVGAGIIGKFLAGEAREGGAVAIDVGSMLDYMAGSKTRSVADLI